MSDDIETIDIEAGNAIEPGFAVEIDKASLCRHIDDLYESRTEELRDFYRSWLEVFLFHAGYQWLHLDHGYNWQPTQLKRKYLDKVVTNKIAPIADNFVALLSQAEPNLAFYPTTMTGKNVVSAAFLDKLEKYILEVNQVRMLRHRRAAWLAFTGNVGLYSGVSEGKLYTEVLSYFEARGDLMIPTLQEQDEMLVVQLRPKNYAERMYPGLELDKKSMDNETDYGMRALQQIARLSPNVSSYHSSYGNTFGTFFGYGGHAKKESGVLFKRYYTKPTSDYPNGLYALKIGNQIVEVKELRVWPFSSAKFGEVPGSLVGTTPLSGLLHKQVQRNKADSTLMLWAKRLGGHTWLLENNMQLTGTFNEDGNELVRYGNAGSSLVGQPPQRLPTEQIPSSLISYIKLLDEDFAYLSSLSEVLRGVEPYSGAPAKAISRLTEQAKSFFGPVLRNLGEMDRSWFKTQIELMKGYQIADKERVYVSLSEDSRWTTQSFEQLNAIDAIDVRIEADNTVPLSQEAENARLIELMNVRFFNLTDQETYMELAKRFGVSNINKNFMEGVESTALEHEYLLSLPEEAIANYAFALEQSKQSGGTIPPPEPLLKVNPLIDNNPVHAMMHQRFCQTDAGRKFIPILEPHIAEHLSSGDALANTGE